MRLSLFARVTFLGAASCALLASCGGSQPDAPAVARSSLSVDSIGHPDGSTILGAPASATWSDGSLYVFVIAQPEANDGGGGIYAFRRALKSNGRIGSEPPPNCVRAPCPDGSTPIPALWYRRLAQGSWGDWTFLGGGGVHGRPTTVVTQPSVTQYDASNRPTQQLPGQLAVFAPNSDSHLTRCYLEVAPEDTVVFTITGPTTFSYTLNGAPAGSNLTIPVGGTFSVPNAHTDLTVGFPAPTWENNYTAGETYTVKPHLLMAVHARTLGAYTPDITVQVTSSTWSSCASVPIAITSDIAITGNLAGPSSTALAQRNGAGHLMVAPFYSVSGEVTGGGCSPSSLPTDPGCQAFFDTGLTIAGAPTSLPVQGSSQTSKAHYFERNAAGQIDHQELAIVTNSHLSETIPVQMQEAPFAAATPAPTGWSRSDISPVDLFGRDAAGNLVRARNYSLATLAAVGADAGAGGRSDAGVGAAGYWTSETITTHLDSAPTAQLVASSSIGGSALLRIWQVLALDGNDVTSMRVREIDDLGATPVTLPDSCSVSDELHMKLTFCNAAATADMLDFCQDALDDIRREQTGACQTTMREFHFNLWLALFDRSLPFGATKAPDTAGISSSLGAIDRFYGFERSLFPEDASTTSSPSAAHTRRLAEVVSQHAYGVAEAALEQATSSPTDPTTVGNAIEQMARATIAVDQQILQVAYGDGQPPLSSPALLWITADRLAAVAERMQQAGRLHDLGCRFRDDCANNDFELAELWHALANVPDAAALKAVLCKPSSPAGMCTDAATAMRGAWKSIFLAVQRNHARLESAARAAMGPSFTGSGADALQLLFGPSASLPAIMQPLGRIVAHAADVYTGYARTGLYDTSISNLLDNGVQEKNVVAMLQTGGALQGQLDRDLSGYKDKQRQYVLDQVGVLKAGGDVTQLQAKLGQLQQQIEDVSSDIEGIRLASRSEKQRQDDFGKELEALLDSQQFDPQMTINKVVDFPTQLNVYADQTAHALTWEGHVSPGDIVLVNVTGQWSPSCSITGFAKGTTDPPTTYAGALTGPEGFAVSYQTNHINIVSNSYSEQHDDYSGNKQSTNVYEGLGWDYILKLGGSYSQSWDQGSTDSNITSNTDSTTSESQATINLNTGLRLPNTPNSNMPAGSLFLEHSFADSSGATGTFTPHLLERQTMFVAPQSNLPNVFNVVKLRFVVNDKTCDLTDAPSHGGSLGVAITVLQPQGALVRQLGTAMGTALASLRNQSKTYIAEGFLTPEESASLRSTALASLDTACNCDATKFEASLLGFYNKWVDSEIAEISRGVEATQKKRTLTQLTSELDATVALLDSAQKQQVLLTLLPMQSLRGLASRYLAAELDQLVSYYTKELYPVAKLRFPQTLTNLLSKVTGSDDLSLLEAATWDDAFVDWADRADRATIAINQQFDISNPPKGVGLVRVVMRFPRDLSQPNPTNPTQQPYHVDPSGVAYLFPHADQFAATAVWDEVMNGDGLGHFVVRPEDLYNKLGGSARLDCNQSAPAIRDMVLVGVLPNSTPTDAQGNNAYSGGIWNVPLDLEENVTYPTAQGPQSFVLDPSLTHYLPRIYFITENKIDATLNTLQQAAVEAATMEVAGGISPFGDFSFNLGAFRQQFQPPSTLKDPLLLISEWMLVFDLESKNVPTSMSWPSPCAP